MSQDGDVVEPVESRKKKVRGGHKAHLTKMFNEIDTLLDGSGPGRDERLSTLRECLVRKAGVLNVLDNEILEEVDPEMYDYGRNRKCGRNPDTNSRENRQD